MALQSCLKKNCLLNGRIESINKSCRNRVHRRALVANCALPHDVATTDVQQVMGLATSLQTMVLSHLSTSQSAQVMVLGDVGTAGLSDLLFTAGQQADDAVAAQLTGVSPVTFLVVLGSGLVTSLSPCTLSVLPLTIGYIGGYSGVAQAMGTTADTSSSDESNITTSGSRGTGGSAPSLGIQALSFTAGLSTTLSTLGLLAAKAGSVYGSSSGGVASVAVSVVAVVMGLNLLEVIPLQLPTLDLDTRAFPIPPALKAYVAGLVFALAASPCSTPVLATLLAYVTSTGDPYTGGALLATYTMGYCAPLLLAASATGVMKRMLSLRQYSAWFTPASGFLLVAGGTYGCLNRLLPP